MRTETIVKKEESDLKLPLKSDKKYSRIELDMMTIKLAEAHGLIK